MAITQSETVLQVLRVAFSLTLSYYSIQDLEKKEVDGLPFVALNGLFLFLPLFLGMAENTATGFFFLGFLYLINLFLFVLTGKEIGDADILAFGVIGALWPHSALLIVAAVSFFAVLLWRPLNALFGKEAEAEIPFLPFIAAGVFAATLLNLP
jgi:hypothetical protein